MRNELGGRVRGEIACGCVTRSFRVVGTIANRHVFGCLVGPQGGRGTGGPAALVEDHDLPEPFPGAEPVERALEVVQADPPVD